MEERAAAFCCALILALFLLTFACVEAVLSGAPGPAAQTAFSALAPL